MPVLLLFPAEQTIEDAAGRLADVAPYCILELLRGYPPHVRPENRVRRSTHDQERHAGVALLAERGHYRSGSVERCAHFEIQSMTGADRSIATKLAYRRRDEFDGLGLRALRRRSHVRAEGLDFGVRSPFDARQRLDSRYLRSQIE